MSVTGFGRNRKFSLKFGHCECRISSGGEWVNLIPTIRVMSVFASVGGTMVAPWWHHWLPNAATQHRKGGKTVVGGGGTKSRCRYNAAWPGLLGGKQPPAGTPGTPWDPLGPPGTSCKPLFGGLGMVIFQWSGQGDRGELTGRPETCLRYQD